MTVSERIFYLLQKQGKRQSDLARALRVRPTTVSEWKNGRREPSSVHYIQLAEYFGVSLDYLIAGRDPPAAVPIQQIIGNSNSHNVVTIASDNIVDEWSRELLKVCAPFDIRRKTALLTYAYSLEKEMKEEK